MADNHRSISRRETAGSRRRARRAALALSFSLLWGWPCRTSADTLVIDRPGAHPNYSFEAEPHLLVGFIDPQGYGRGNGIGVGFRGTVELVDNGFVSKINNTVGLGFGADIVQYNLGRRRCIRNGANAECLAYNGDENVTNLWLPLVMQWNFWLSRNWSVFGEPGLAFRYESSSDDGDYLDLEAFQLYLGGRYHFSETTALTMRLGYPTFSVGVSFLL